MQQVDLQEKIRHEAQKVADRIAAREAREAELAALKVRMPAKNLFSLCTVPFQSLSPFSVSERTVRFATTSLHTNYLYTLPVPPHVIPPPQRHRARRSSTAGLPQVTVRCSTLLSG